MFGLDERIVALSDGTTLWIVLLVAVLLGVRHATDPDHLAAVTTLVASGRAEAARSAARLGFSWGAGHALALFAFGLPVVLLNRYLPEGVQRAAETLIALVIVVLAVRLIVRWRRGEFDAHLHARGGLEHVRLHGHRFSETEDHDHPLPTRTPLGAFGIGLVHGVGGSAGIGVLVLAAVESAATAVAALGVLAVFTALSMTILSTGLGAALVSEPVQGVFDRIAPVLGGASLAFGIWYGLGALDLAPYGL